MAKTRHKGPDAKRKRKGPSAPRNTQTTSPERVAIDQRRKEMLDLRVQGYSLRAIADKLGMHHSSVAEAIAAELDALTREPAEQLKTVELERMDAMLVALWPKVEGGDVASIQAALGVMQRRSKLLGLDAPVKTVNDNKHSGGDGPPVRVTVTPEQALAELREELEDNPELRRKVLGE